MNHQTNNCRVCNIELTDDNWYPSFKSAHSAICNKCELAYRARVRLKWREEFKGRVIYPFQCGVCNSELNEDTWRPSDKRENHLICRECANRYARGLYASRAHVHIKRKPVPKSMSENKKCTLYLGVYVAERVLSKVFKHVERMPIHNSGFDFICNRGKKIDVKSSCITKDKRWTFKIDQNQVPDFFLLLAFDNRKKLNPMHMWLIPSDDVCQRGTISVAPSTVNKWDKYQLPIEKVVTCCKEIRS